MGKQPYSEVTLAFVLGALAGSAVALLYAPAAGVRTRRQIAEAAARLRDDSEKKYEQGREYVADTLARGKEYLHERKDQVGDTVTAVKEALTPTR